jgi:hypothetical protein
MRMVKKGDIIETEDGNLGKVTDILKGDDGRYVILYKEKGCPHYCVEGDDLIKVVKKGKK